MLLTDDLGNTVKTPTDSVALGLRPSSGIGLKHQTPHTHKGVKLTGEVLEKLEALRRTCRNSRSSRLPRHA
jgi:hypothetical protein